MSAAPLIIPSMSSPLIVPSLPNLTAFATIKVGMHDFIGRSISPFTGSRQVFDWRARWLTASVELPPIAGLINGLTARQWCAFLAGSNGVLNTFLLGDSSHPNPYGSVAGSGPFIVQAVSGDGSAVAIAGFTPSASNVLRAGDWIQLGDGGPVGSGYYPQRLYMSLTDVSADSTGLATVSLYPPYREIPGPYLWNTNVDAWPSAKSSDLESGHLGVMKIISLSGGWSTSYQVAPKGNTWNFVFTPSGSYTIGVDRYLESGDTAGRCRFTAWCYDVNGNLLGYLTAGDMVSQTVGVWQATQNTGTLPAGTAYVQLVLDVYHPTSTTTCRFTNLYFGTDSTRSTGNIVLNPDITSPLVVFNNPVGTFSLATNDREYSVDNALTYGISFDAMEAF